MFDNLQGRLEKAFKSLKGQGRITDLNVAETVKEIRRALISADVNFKVAKEFTDTILEQAKGRYLPDSYSQKLCTMNSCNYWAGKKAS